MVEGTAGSGRIVGVVRDDVERRRGEFDAKRRESCGYGGFESRETEFTTRGGRDGGDDERESRRGVERGVELRREARYRKRGEGYGRSGQVWKFTDRRYIARDVYEVFRHRERSERRRRGFF